MALAVGAKQRRSCIDPLRPISGLFKRTIQRALKAKAEIERLQNLRFDEPELGPKVPAEVFAYRQLLISYPENEGAEEALWRLGTVYEEIKQFELAAQSLAELARRFSETLHEIWWKTGQIYDRRLDDKEQALAA